MAFTNKYVLFRLSKSLIFLLVFFVSNFLLTEAEDNLNLPIIIDRSVSIDYQNHIDRGLLGMLTDSTYYSQEGGSSYYGKAFHNRRTASGQRFDMHKYTAAHRKLPFGSIVRIQNLNNDKTTLAIINDRGPFIRRRIIDMSKQVALAVGSLGIPSVKISGISNAAYPDSNYFTGNYIVFPLIADVQISAKSDINFMKQFDDFSEAVEFLHILQELHTNVPYCLVVSANEYFGSRFDRKYYVGILLHDHYKDNLLTSFF